MEDGKLAVPAHMNAILKEIDIASETLNSISQNLALDGWDAEFIDLEVLIQFSTTFAAGS